MRSKIPAGSVLVRDQTILEDGLWQGRCSRPSLSGGWKINEESTNSWSMNFQQDGRKMKFLVEAKYLGVKLQAQSSDGDDLA